MIDIHVHTGHFNDGLYFSPDAVAEDMKSLNVERYYFSSTSTGNIPFRQVMREIDDLVSLSEGRAFPFLWISPGMLRHSPTLKTYFYREFSGIKIHGLQGWRPDGKELHRVVNIARDKNLPVLLHTGEHDICRAGVYKNICCEFPDVKIILAHGRPIDECIDVMKECPNAYTDTAFMPVEDIVKLNDSGLIERVLWGSDFPVMTYFYDMPAKDYYKQKVQEVRAALGDKDFMRITSGNLSC